MPSLREVLSAHAPLLVIDAASSRVQLGWLASPGDMRWEASDEEAGVAVFRGVEKLGCDVNAAAAFAFCDGPGSILGIRTAAMALRAWLVLNPRPVFSYTSLAMVAHALGRADVGVVSDARRDAWHHYQLGSGLRRLPASGIAADAELVTPSGFRNWAALPVGVKQVPYLLSDLVPRVIDFNLMRRTESPEAFLHEEPSYVTWTPQVHRGPTFDEQNRQKA